MPSQAEKSPFARRYGPVAVVAGASEGIGAAFARALAGRGLDLVLVARRAQPLEALAQELRASLGVAVRTEACDLGEERAADSVSESCRGLEVGLLVYNAASSSVGRFLETPVEEHLRAIRVNARGPVVLAHRFGQAMAERGRGGIVFMSSLTGFQGTPLVATYGATKAFNLVLAEGLWSELGERGVDVLACCAGATLTPGYDRATPRRETKGIGLAPRPQSPADVAREALDALGHGPSVVTGRGNRIVSLMMRRVFSRRLAITTMAKAMRARYGSHLPTEPRT
jgi:short-subunit dehydrogenase